MILEPNIGFLVLLSQMFVLSLILASKCNFLQVMILFYSASYLGCVVDVKAICFSIEFAKFISKGI